MICHFDFIAFPFPSLSLSLFFVLMIPIEKKSCRWALVNNLRDSIELFVLEQILIV